MILCGAFTLAWIPPALALILGGRNSAPGTSNPVAVMAADASPRLRLCYCLVVEKFTGT